YEVQVPIPSIARCRRVAYPGHRKGTTHERLGGKSHGCSTVEAVAGGAIWVASTPAGLHIKKRTAASRRAPSCNRCTGCAMRRPGPNEGQAAVVEEETGRGSPRDDGGGGQARREGCAERTSGRSPSPQGRSATRTD